MILSIAIHGRQPGISRAELESLFGATNLTPIGNTATGLTLPSDRVPFERLGGTVKLAKILTRIDTTHWPEIEKYLAKMIPEHLQYVPAEGKFKLGISVYGLNVPVGRINATGLSLKKVIKGTGRSVRIIPNKAPDLNAAQVTYNQLTSPLGWELLLIKDSNATILAQTTRVQDIDAYAARDQARPMRDARVGMLPPKLAQTIINLAQGKFDEPTAKSQQPTVLDPFCGTGVVLQEALLMGYNVYGTDLDVRMVEYSSKNVIDWFNMTIHPEIHRKVTIAEADATRSSWEKFDAIAAETYLGRPFSAAPAPDVLKEVIRDVDTIHRKFLLNVARQTKTGFRMCLAVPAWAQTSKFKLQNSNFEHLPMLDHLTDMGYNRLSFVHTSRDELIYHRENQIVGRELIVLVRK